MKPLPARGGFLAGRIDELRDRRSECDIIESAFRQPLIERAAERPQIRVGKLHGPLEAAVAVMHNRLASTASAAMPFSKSSPATISSLSGWKRINWQRERIVGSCLAGLVPIKISTERGGGSSSVFSRAFAPSAFRKSASSMIAIFRPPMKGFRPI